MKRVLRWIGIGLAAVIAGVSLIAIFARMSGGPLGPFPGGPLQGELVADPVDDWSFAVEFDTIAIQTLDPPRSRTVWMVVDEGALYVPSGLVATKAWPHQLIENPRALLRVDGALHMRKAVRITDPAVLEPLWALVAAKYGPDVAGDYERNWIFRMDPPDADG